MSFLFKTDYTKEVPKCKNQYIKRIYDNPSYGAYIENYYCPSNDELKEFKKMSKNDDKIIRHLSQWYLENPNNK